MQAVTHKKNKVELVSNSS